ncbi:hypothetical protein GH809_23540 [Klebsiella pneumoniae]|uniref:hypothetical protein n=1 Tax=Klebsiella pneumoniae TaxID=573 RepID=UPI000DA86727|nr:hypothetical protein [Klebsiella pneumoniae]HBQ6055615.1 hypothetical protein [Klebsiella pneumoniae subsp. pneumoniae]MRJ53182.1 hypothetical protein [Klebsiella pneumoniae]PZD98802.1 hypothetical protein DND31_24950 [Klebsiella pneumoniae]PZE05778.1 hypothetical protein DND32_18045 [Klebsiella pneumoniae]HBY7310207.1 hypothetical protein [Klebsiella pneumoniae]
MTKSTITRERAQQIFLGNGPEPSASEERELARMALAAMDSEPVAIIDQANLDYLRSGADADVWPPEREEMGDVLLYRHTQPAPVVPDGYVMVPMRLTAENGAKGALSGEFSETKFVNCPECFGDDECETCDGSGRIEITVPVTWTTIKEIWAKGVEHFSATPREVKGE